MHTNIKCIINIFCLFILTVYGNAADLKEFITVVDSRNVHIKIPKQICRIVTISDGLVEGVITFLDEEEKIVGLGSLALQEVCDYSFETKHNEKYYYKNGMNTVRYLNPNFKNLPLIAKNGRLNYEAIVALRPDVVIAHYGSCYLWFDRKIIEKTTKTIESLGLPLVVLYGDQFYNKSDSSAISNSIRILGKVFGKEPETEKLVKYLESQVEFVKNRTKNIIETEKPSVLIFGLSLSARKKGGAGVVFGLNTIESSFIQDVVNAKNAFQEPGHFRIINVEHIFTLDPDVIVLCTAAGYHPVRELYEAPYYSNLSELNAIKKKKVTVLPWTPYNCAKRLEYPIEIMVIAKAAYPDLFADLDLGKWLLDFYRNIYNVDSETAKALRKCQWMEWTAN